MPPQTLWAEGPAGNRLHLTDWGGTGPGVLLLHGMGAHSGWWDPVVPLLPPGRRFVALDLRGHGDSAWTEPPAYMLDDYAADVEAVRAALGWASFDLAAHSLGARVALRYATGHGPRLRSLGLLDFFAADWHGRESGPVGRPPATYGDRDAILDRFRLQPAGTLLDAASLRQVGMKSVRQAPDGRWQWKFDWRALYPRQPWDPAEPSRAAVPTLLVRGEASLTMPRASFQSVLNALPDARGVQIPRAHHHITLDAPAETAGALASFWDSLS
ncbi:alpha/beta hydrolase [bacterium]|nr:MAG: alpha/beta hydrolase [bacterium]